MAHAINFQDKLQLFSDHWSPKIIAQMNDYHVKLVKIHGDFVWHSHPETDELFMVLEGSMDIAFRDGSVTLRSGELYVVPRGVSTNRLRRNRAAFCCLNLPAQSTRAMPAATEPRLPTPGYKAFCRASC